MKDFLRSIWHKRLLEDDFSWWAVFLLFKALRFLIGFEQQKIEVLNYNQVSIILTPLSGSSSLKSLFKSAVSSQIEHTEVYILDRTFLERCKSFHTKKIIACDSIGKVWLLSRMAGLRRTSSYASFVESITRNRTVCGLEKHLWTSDEILGHFGISSEKVKFLHIGDKKLMDILGVDAIPTVNSSVQVGGTRDVAVRPCDARSAENLAIYEKAIGANV